MLRITSDVEDGGEDTVSLAGPSGLSGLPDPIFQRLALPRLSLTEAEALGVISRRAQFGSNAHTWQLSLTRAENQAVRDQCDRHVEIEWAGARLFLRFPSRAAALWMAQRLGLNEDADHALDPVLHTAALEAMLNDVLERLGAIGFGLPRLSDEPSAAKPAHVFVLMMALPHATVMMQLETDAFGVMLIAGLLEHHVDATNRIAVDALRIPLRMVLGDAVIDVATLGSLAVGDIVRCRHCSVQTAGFALPVAATSPDGAIWRMQLQADPEDQGLLRSLQFMGYEKGMADKLQDGSGHAVSPHEVDSHEVDSHGVDPDEMDLDDERPPGASVEQMPVTLRFDLGTRTVTLGELRRLQPGEVVVLSRPLASAVQIRANGMLIGRGEMVEVDGSIGIAITRLFGPDAS